MYVVKVADNIVSPMGLGTEQNLRCVMAGRSTLKSRTGMFGIDGDFFTSVFEPLYIESGIGGDYNKFEKLCILAAKGAIEKSEIDVSGDDTIFVISTTKGDLETPLAGSAAKVAGYFGNKVKPVVVSNACTSGCAAQIIAMRLLKTEVYKNAVVIGADLVSKFILSGFNCLKALSFELCKPYSKDRFGLNLGEAGAAIVYSAAETVGKYCWTMDGGVIRNDANHISGPSRNGEGAYRALRYISDKTNVPSVALISAHGTATQYNDDMESWAIERAGLSSIPVNSLKGYYGHTLGAAGILETILNMKAMESNTLIGTRGFEELGVACMINVKAEHQSTQKHTLVKLLSGFGGVNTAALYNKKHTSGKALKAPQIPQLNIIKSYEIDGSKPLADLYKEYGLDYQKFFKMDGLSKLGFLCSEMLLKGEPENENTAVILFNRNSSKANDDEYIKTISDGNYYPSPSLFVYTLPNIVTGEIAIRHKFYGETSLYVTDSYDEDYMKMIVNASLMDRETKRVIYGWVDYESDEKFGAKLFLGEVLTNN